MSTEQTVRATCIRDVRELKWTLLRPRLADCERRRYPVLRRLVHRNHSQGGEGANPVSAHKMSQVSGQFTKRIRSPSQRSSPSNPYHLDEVQ